MLREVKTVTVSMDKIGKSIRYSLLNCPKIIINIIIITISTVFCPCNVLYNFSPNKLNVTVTFMTVRAQFKMWPLF